MGKVQASAEIHADLKMPCAIRKPKGAAKKKRHKGPLEGVRGA
jgi:hypothetical protein